jgi:hypothetical protein
VPRGKLFRAPEAKLKATGTVNYLGDAKIVAAIERDNIVGFKGPQVRRGLDSAEPQPSPPVAARASSSPALAVPSSAPAAAVPRAPRPVPPTPPAAKAAGPGPGSASAARPSPPPQAATPNAAPAPAPGPALAARPSPPPQAVKPTAATAPLAARGQSESALNVGRPRPAATAASATAPAPPPPAAAAAAAAPAAIGQIRVKCHHRDVRVVLVDATVTQAALVAEVAAKHACAPATLRLRYQDEDGDRVLLTDDEDLAMALAATNAVATGKLELWCS